MECSLLVSVTSVGYTCKSTPVLVIASRIVELTCPAYSPEDDSPFYRATVFSNYSPNNCPQADAKITTIQTADPALSGSVDTTTAREGPCKHRLLIACLRETLLTYSPMLSDWSLMLEVSQSNQKPVDEENLLRDCMAGMINTGLLQPEDEIVSTYHRKFVSTFAFILA